MRVQLRAVRFVGEPQDGFIEAYLTDSTGFDWQIVDKVEVFSEYSALLDADRALPMAVTLNCFAVRDDGGDTVDIALPGVSDRVFGVLRESLLLD